MGVCLFRKWGMTFLALMATGVLMANPVVNINGSDVENAISKITFNGDYAVLHFQNGTSQSEDMDDVIVRFSAETGTTIALNDVFVASALVEDVLVVKGVVANASIRIYDALGNLKLQSVATGAGCSTITVSSLPHGVYLLVIDNMAIKFVKK